MNKNNLFVKIVVWALIIMMLGSVVGTLLFYLFM